MEHDARASVAIVAGALVGGIVGYLFFTERGRSWRRQIEPALEDFAREVATFRGTVQRTIGVAADSWDAVADTADRATRAAGIH